MACKGSESAGSFNNVVVVAKLAILAFIVSVALYFFDIRNFNPIIIPEKGVTGVVEATTILFFGYLGFDFITTISEEAINPKRSIPLAINISVLGSMLIYSVVAFSISGMGNLADVGGGDGETALADIFASKGLPYMYVLILLCALIGISAASMTNLMSQSRILYAYAKDGLFFKVFKEIDPKTKVPVKGAWIALIPICLSAFCLNLKQLASLCSLCNLMTYSFIDAGVLALRLKKAPVTNSTGFKFN